MKIKRWTPEEETFIRENAGKMTYEEMASKVGRSVLAVHLFIHRRHIVIRNPVKRNLVLEILRVKFRHPENFMPSRNFYSETGINQVRWWKIYRGEQSLTQEEYLALSSYFGLTLEEAFNTRQLSLFDEE